MAILVKFVVDTEIDYMYPVGLSLFGTTHSTCFAELHI